MSGGWIVWGNSLVKRRSTVKTLKLFVAFFVLVSVMVAEVWGQVFYPSNVVEGNIDGDVNVVLIDPDIFGVAGNLRQGEHLRSVYFTPGEGWEGWSVILSQGVGQIFVGQGSFLTHTGGVFSHMVLFPESGEGGFDGNDQVLISIERMPVILGDWGFGGFTEVNPDGDLVPQNGLYWAGEIVGSSGESRGWLGHIVPEPAEYAGLFTLGLLGFVAFRRWCK